MMLSRVLSRSPRMLRVVPVLALDDNYMYIVYNEKTGKGLTVDPVHPDKIEQMSKTLNVPIVAALVTHHHGDHAGGMILFRQMWEKTARVYAGDDRIASLDEVVRHEQTLDIEGMQVKCIHTPCHTHGHFCYYITTPEDQTGVVLTGDTLFIAGCGKFFEGNASQMYENLNGKLGTLPDETKVYCGHEYTVNNLKFARLVDPDNEAVKAKLTWAEERRSRNEPTIPSTIGEEKEINPFMRVHLPAIQKYVGEDSVIQCTDGLRFHKNNFKAN